MKKLKINNSGAASMLTVIFVAIILTIITIGFIRLAINEQRSATDDDLTTRAYYAAESGVEDAKRALREFTAGKLTEDELNADECIPPDSPEYTQELSTFANYDIEYTCQLIELRPASLHYEFEGANETIQVPIYPIATNGTPANFQRITIRWHLNGDQPDGDGIVGSSGSVVKNRSSQVIGSYPDVATWGSATNNWPAMFRVGILRHPIGSNWGRSDVRQYVAFVEPRNNDSSPAPSWPSPPNFTIPNLGFPIEEAECDPSVASDDYFCEITFTGLPANGFQFYLRLTSLYRGAHVEINISNAAGQPRLFDRAQAVADVTGRAGQVFRRVQTTIDLISPNIFPDAAITSLKDICKDFFITDEYDDFGGIAGTSCTQP